MNRHPSDSSVQQNAEQYLLNALQKRLALQFDSNSVLPVNIGIRPDAVDTCKKAVVEVYARVGEVKGGQKHKIKGDILKLIFLERRLGKGWRKILCFASDEAAAFVTGNSWVAQAVEEFEIEVHVVELPENLRAEILSAQERQCMVNPS